MKRVLVNIRGTNGSGKSTVMRHLIDLFKMDEVDWTENASGYKSTRHKIAVVGKYKTACGGCDGIHPQQHIKDAILEAFSRGSKIVLFEGIMASLTFGPWAEFVEANGLEPVWAYLDTPPELCLERIYKRNGGKAIKEDLVLDKVRATERTRDKFSDLGHRVVTLPHKKARKAAEELVNGLL